MPALITLENFALSVGSTQLLDGVSASVVEGQRIAVVGPNGCGKSTLLRALSGSSEDYYVVGAGSVASRGAVLLVEQDALQWSRLLPLAECDEAGLREMTLPDALDMAAAASGDEGAMEDVEAWRRLSIAAQEALDWKTATYDATPLGRLSPGSATRAYLAVALRRRDVKLLLLDEPTNYLDIPSMLWLQETILASGKAVVVVSHDEAFLDAVADHVWDVDPDKRSLSVSGARYSAYCRAKALAREQQRVAYDAQQERHKRLTTVANKLRQASAKGERHAGTDHDLLQRDFRRNRAGRSGRKAKAIESLRDSEPRVERVVDRAPLRIDLDAPQVGGDSSIILGSVVIGYDGEPLPFLKKPITLRVDFGERVAIVGYNGVGKSSLLRSLTGAIEPCGGDVHVGRELRVGNLTQEHETLPRNETPREHLSAKTGMSLFDARARLIRYGLTRQQVDRPIGQLNPGARARALLASFAIRKVNALVLDEPSNHLDDEAVAEVIATLNEYEGTVIVVSHSRDFLESLQLTRILRLGSDGLTEIESVDAFVRVTEEAVRAVVTESFRS
ncbi:hypothetical protein CTAYLR_005601 [Chrysophaeum taylorii]|uniref:ABC transporter domain-containing protein n=1 Tax=Chrysophaeum taylorii TaxID=2483200 RepID=A0AAD7XKW2_9STRA|nr:hypothetical protein CTAYLR_005601 [Chrysophaeum taylorii]